MATGSPWGSNVPTPAPLPVQRRRTLVDAPPTDPSATVGARVLGALPIDGLMPRGMPAFGPDAVPDMRGIVDWLEGRDDGAWLGADTGVRLGRRPPDGLLDPDVTPRWSGSTLAEMISGPGAPYGPVGRTGFSDVLVGYLDRIAGARSAEEIDALVQEAQDGSEDVQPLEAPVLFRAGGARKGRLDGGPLAETPGPGGSYGPHSELDDPMLQDLFARIDAAGSEADLQALRLEMSGVPVDAWGRAEDALDQRAWQLQATPENVFLHGLPPWGVDAQEPALLPSIGDLPILPRAGYGGWPFEIIDGDTARGVTLTLDGLPGGVDVPAIVPDRWEPSGNDGVDLVSPMLDEVFKERYREFDYPNVVYALLGTGRLTDAAALAASVHDTAMLDILRTAFPDAPWGRDSKGNLITVIGENPYYLNAPGLDELDLLRGTVANGPIMALGGGVKALGRRVFVPAAGWVTGALGLGAATSKDFRDAVGATFDLAGDAIEIPYEAALDDFTISRGSKVPPRHESFLDDMATTTLRNIGKMFFQDWFEGP